MVAGGEEVRQTPAGRGTAEPDGEGRSRARWGVERRSLTGRRRGGARRGGGMAELGGERSGGARRRGSQRGRGGGHRRGSRRRPAASVTAEAGGRWCGDVEISAREETKLQKASLCRFLVENNMQTQPAFQNGSEP
ncbi:hypothetical protein GUJ93_ZPchr0014g47640 [Zizania palustris]|uniref:Uncharacterized protein n=1 Tax=Zizania palustris TaxID=103762 RepID=A0A8J5VV57_ZIZPA|nr:hypothetical protein GUJ93_ZPchr0014g47640 [Zizania palustris]